MELKNYQKIVYDTAINCGLKDVQAKLIVGQATLESGRFKSNVFLKTNNAFGMKVPNKRPKTYIKGASGIVMKSEGSTPYAEYESLQQSVTDLIKGWHIFNKTNWEKITTANEYANYLKSKGYYGSDIQGYISNIANTVKTLSWIRPATNTIAVLFFISIASYLIYKNYY